MLATASPHLSPTSEKSVVVAESVSPPEDPSCPIKGMYRLLDLIMEQGSGGLVDKIVIAQESLQAFINAISPGAYSSITKVNFKKLDNLLLKPIGVYGSKEEIVRFLREMGSVDVEMCELLVLDRDYTARGEEPILRSGLYIMRTFTSAAEEQTYVLYWPEDTTWDDNAVSMAQRNRVTFMSRYLTKICDQLICLLSSKNSQAIVWGDEVQVDDQDDTSIDLENIDSDRLFDFMVEKKSEQEENVTARQGFMMNSSRLSRQVSTPKVHIDQTVLSPRLLYGETTQGFMTAAFRPARSISEPFSHDYQSASQIRLLIEDDVVLCLSETLDDKALKTLMLTMKLSTRFPEEYGAWEQRRIEIEKRFQKIVTQRQEKIHETLEKESGDLESRAREAVIGEILKSFPLALTVRLPLSLRVLTLSFGSISFRVLRPKDPLHDVFSTYPKAKSMFLDATSAEKLDDGLKGTDFDFRKERLLILLHLIKNYPNLNSQQTMSLRDAVLDNKDNQKALKTLKGFAKGEKTKWFSVFWKGKQAVLTKEEAMWREANEYASSLSNLRFLKYVKTFPPTNYLHGAAVKCEEAAYTCLRTQVDSQVPVISQKILSILKEERNKQVQSEVKSEGEEDLKVSRVEFVQKIEDLCRERSTSFVSLRVRRRARPHGRLDSYYISGRKETLQNQEIEYAVHILRLQADERHNLQLEPSYVPTPVLNERLSQSFHMPSETVVKYAHLLEGDRILLCLVDCKDLVDPKSKGKVMIILDRLSHVDGAIESRSYAKFFDRDRIGEKSLFAFDESKRLLAVYASAKMELHMFQFDEEFKSLRGYGAKIDLRPFYNPGVSILQACFVHGTEEILFVDSSAQARIFSLITLQPRPASLELPQIPRAIYSAPDGSCLLVIQEEGGKRTITAYHWSTFASTDGISVTLPYFPVDLDAALLTSIVNLNNIHLVGLSLDTQSCRSVALDITRKATEFSFQERHSKGSSNHGKQTVHNCLIDCHKDVWTRFPVVAAVKRQTITSSSQRQQKTLVFVTDDHQRPFSSHFSNMISAFEKTSRKPTGDELKSIMVSARAFPSFTQEFLSSPNWPVSRFRAGEWIADLLCLIPIHIAITHENRFVPLKDGVVSPQLEKSLLGAEVNRIVDSLTVGWYESIFQSYWASKPVKVVSSMGEQSVGKSFTLNHLVDTSFAGSAMRTTEGVWMSVSPTEDALIVALDFEGVHSLERSAQEDTLLVLFNTAISNLVLFRNNFALSRDISGLFQSFQSSSSVLDPASNPSLFQSTLVVIIKDVIDTDKREVMKEFALKFQKIVQDEQDANFITRLHGGKLQIIPWPVIGSIEFYRLFSAVKQKLDQQKTSHRTAGEFLLTLKTLMAKLKANDWGAMSQTMAAHRASSLLAILPVALQTGYSEVSPELEPLKGFDTDIVVEAEDTEALFLLSGPETPAADREDQLSILIESWDRSESRQQVEDPEWISDLGKHLTHLVDLRVSHVEEWLKSNTQRFQAENASMEELRRAFNSAVIDLRASVQLCKSQCADCNLLCIRSRSHEGDHDCLTIHKCIHDCTFCDKQLYSQRTCGQIAGHKGDHVCHVDVHLCGKPCKLSGKQGCADECVKPIQHEGDHICSAPVHMCGQPCDLIDLELPDGNSFTCPGKCRVPITEEHKVHECENRLCPISCQLCKRLCSGNHLHGLSDDENHLCGQEHSCSALCSADGICQIDTTPLSIEATFNGRHETFQYTKFTQTAKRLNCVKIIEPGAIEHKGLHVHIDKGQPFHFCESRCGTCGYLCTLPFGHTQQEHETSHGSMSRTRWAVDGPEGSCIELGGRKFAANDDGAPMLCNLVCTSMGRHVHIDDCRGNPHDNSEVLHINERIVPNPDQAKDWITHGLHWRLNSSVDPYPREDQANFAKCDAMCPGPEHTAEGGATNPQPSRCTLPMFHPNVDAEKAPPGLGYVSKDGHHFQCKNPIMMQQSFHVIFVIDRSGSMYLTDRQPIPNSAGADSIVRKANNRLGAVFSALYSFWIARQAAVDRNPSLGGDRRDAYSLIFFNHEALSSSIENDFTSSPDKLLTAALAYGISGGTDFTRALEKTQELMTTHWSTERTPVVIFLSDGEDHVRDNDMYKFCRSAASQGRPLSFHAVSFGEESSSSSLRRMAQIALEVQNDGANNPVHHSGANVPSSYTEALDTVRLAETFLVIAESLRKPRGFLFQDR
ncbi:hypothetical protein EI94DRAFT_1572312 [Lactarius quietus]|nr:hypothetical protein EI94DRAFT_1572312 [Lactarius quietus]